MSLVLWYKFNGSSLGLDSSGFSRSMGNAGVTSFSDSQIGNVAFLDGTSYLSLASSAVPAAMMGGSSRTISFWAKTTSSTTVAVHGNGSPFAQRRFRGQLGGGTTYGIDLHTSTAIGSTVNPLGSWGHFVCTFDSGTSALKTYVNGVLDASIVENRVDTASSTFSIGRDSTNTTYAHFNGYLSDFRVYDGALDAAAISSLTNAGPLGAGVVEPGPEPEPEPEPNPQTETDAEVGGHTPLVWYKFSGSNLGEDSSGFSRSMVNTGATSFSDSEIGNVVFLNGSSYLSLSSSVVPAAMLGSSSRTISFWAKTGSTTGGALHGNGSNFAQRRFRGRLGDGTTYGIDLHTSTAIGSTVNPLGSWGHFVCTFDSGTSALKTYVDGVLDASIVETRVNTGSGTFAIGRDPTNPTYAYFSGYVSDFRVYGAVLDAAAISSLSSAGPLGVVSSTTDDAGNAEENNIGTLAVQTYRTAADLTWDSVPQASTYTLTQTLSGGREVVAANNTYNLSFTTKNLLPGSSYEFKLYTDLDLLNPAGVVHGTTIGEDVSLNDVFETGDRIKLSIPGFRDKTGAKFVKRGGRVDYAPGVPVVLAFDPDEGPGQSATLGLTDNTDATVSFNEETDEVSVDGITCAVGGYVIVDGKKMSVVDI